MAGPLDVLTAIQNGVVALNDLGKQVSGSFTSIKSQLIATVTSIAGNSGAFTLNGASGITNTVNDIQLSQGSSSQFGAVKVNATTITAPAGVLNLSMSQIINSISSDVSLNNTAVFFDGPSVAQGSSGTWFASGTVTLLDTAGSALFFLKLWDGTTIIASATTNTPVAASVNTVSLSGFITSPASNIKISVRDNTSVNGKISAGGSKDSTITAIRIA